jgi:hypothetical protein
LEDDDGLSTSTIGPIPNIDFQEAEAFEKDRARDLFLQSARLWPEFAVERSKEHGKIVRVAHSLATSIVAVAGGQKV